MSGEGTPTPAKTFLNPDTSPTVMSTPVKGTKALAGTPKTKPGKEKHGKDKSPKMERKEKPKDKQREKEKKRRKSDRR
jgi:hypothetical protein